MSHYRSDAGSFLQIQKGELLMWISPASPPRRGCFESVIINRRHITLTQQQHLCERGKTRALARFSYSRPFAEATDVRRDQS